MHPALWISKSGVDAQQLNVSVISNNLANVSTTGFKKDRAVFQDLLYQKVKQVGAFSSESTNLPSGLQVGTGVQAVASQKIFKQGNIIHTENSLDMAINGRGFFQVQRPDGTIGYTRDGQFQIDDAGKIVNSNGLEMLPNITIPSDSNTISISSDGIVSVSTATSSTPIQVGQLQIADFINQAGLEPMGDNLFKETNASGTPAVSNPTSNGAGSILQGSIETSNVNVVEELVHLIETQRSYQMNTKAVEAVDKMLEFATQVL